MTASKDPLDDYYLDVFGQQPGLNIYTQISLFFAVADDDDSSQSHIVNTLTAGLKRLGTAFPWLAGQVVNEGAGEGNSGVFKVKPLDGISQLVVKDLRHDNSLSMATFRKSNFPMTMLDETIIAPRTTLPNPDTASLPKNVDGSVQVPVFLLQANFIAGGLILTFNGQHQTMDMTGQGHIMYLFSKACRDEPFSSEELSDGNIARRDIIPLLDDSYKQGSELDHQIVKPKNSTPAPPPPSTWNYFTFPPASLAALKSLATKSITSDYISTDDAMSALIWQSIVRARLPRLNPTDESRFARAVNARHYLGISPTYPGMAQNMTYSADTLQRLAEEPLGAVASQLRSQLDPKTLGYTTRALATRLNSVLDRSLFSFTATIDVSADLMVSSWAQIDCFNFDFGFGKPESVRRPRFTPFESLIYLMPKKPDGEIAVAICLRDEDMDRLKADEQWAKYATLIG